MLQTQTVSPELLELLNKIMKSEVFSDFILVGGTALALQIGHRNSVDIDMFGNSEINNSNIEILRVASIISHEHHERWDGERGSGWL